MNGRSKVTFVTAGPEARGSTELEHLCWQGEDGRRCRGSGRTHRGPPSVFHSGAASAQTPLSEPAFLVSCVGLLSCNYILASFSFHPTGVPGDIVAHQGL